MTNTCYNWSMASFVQEGAPRSYESSSPLLNTSQICCYSRSLLHTTYLGYTVWKHRCDGKSRISVQSFGGAHAGWGKWGPKSNHSYPQISCRNKSKSPKTFLALPLLLFQAHKMKEVKQLDTFLLEWIQCRITTCRPCGRWQLPLKRKQTSASSDLAKQSSLSSHLFLHTYKVCI